MQIVQNGLAKDEVRAQLNVMDDFAAAYLSPPAADGEIPASCTSSALALSAAGVPPAEVTFTEDDRAFVYAIARRIVGDDDAAADVTQDALLLAFRHRGSFRGSARYRTWLYRIAATTALSHLRRRRRRRVADTVSLGTLHGLEVELPAPGLDPEEQVGVAQAAARVRTTLERLDPRYREVLRLRFEEGCSEDEVAGALGLSVANVKIRTYRGRNALRAALAA